MNNFPFPEWSDSNLVLLLFFSIPALLPIAFHNRTQLLVGDLNWTDVTQVLELRPLGPTFLHMHPPPPPTHTQQFKQNNYNVKEGNTVCNNAYGTPHPQSSFPFPNKGPESEHKLGPYSLLIENAALC